MKQIIRTEKAGVFFGEVKERNGQEAVLTNARRIWYWDGAASLSQLAAEGTKKPYNCKFTMQVNEIVVLGVIEIIPCTEAAIDNINSVQEWKM
jgi:hypothetical protein